MDLKQPTQEEFLEESLLPQADWDKANIDFESLRQIAIDHQNNLAHLNEVAEYIAKVLQKCDAVHSVRWRVKDPMHVIKKIVRKRAEIEPNPKYTNINIDNYKTTLTDLVGIRVLHLFKSQWQDIHDYILSAWKPTETPIAYIRSGDEGGNITNAYKASGCEIKKHDAGYRSVHYVISSQPTKINIVSEIQVRTIFEEGWSEIDHKIRYPNYSDNGLISYFLSIFNGLAGNADEMGSFVNDLAKTISLTEQKITEAEAAHEKTKIEAKEKQENLLLEIEKLLSELAAEKQQGEDKSDKIQKLQEEFKKLKSNSDGYYPYGESGLAKHFNDVLRQQQLASLELTSKKMSNLGITTAALANLKL